jgi:hypothetical protein
MNLVPIDGFDGYAVSECGDIFSYRPANGRGPLRNEPRRLRPLPVHGKKDNGYFRVGLYRNGILYRNCMVHHIVAKAFIPNPLSLPEVNHKNGIKSDCSASNLEWMTKQQNMAHSRAVLRRCTGQNHGRAKLTNSDAILICTSQEPAVKLAKLLGVHKTTVLRVRKNQGWKHDKIHEFYEAVNKPANG